MDDAKRKILSSVLEFLVLAVLALAVYLVVKYDAVDSGKGVSETSLTELGQEGLVFFTVAMLGVSAWRRPESRGFLVLMAGFFLCVLIREWDWLFDKISHGSWVYVAGVTTVVSLWYAWKCRETVLSPLADWLGSRSYGMLLVGLLIVLVFSRTFGSSRIWKGVMGTDYSSVYKQTIQEGLELFGYVFVFYGAWLLFRGSGLGGKE